jgi:hypothetical protein
MFYWLGIDTDISVVVSRTTDRFGLMKAYRRFACCCPLLSKFRLTIFPADYAVLFIDPMQMLAVEESKMP